MRAAAAPIAFLALLAGCAVIPRASDTSDASATLTDSNGRKVGSAVLDRSGGHLRLTVGVSGLPASKIHGMHLHMVGACDAPGFASAGGHLNPALRQHGSANPLGSHLGDLPNLTIGANGSGRATVLLDGDPAVLIDQLLDADGTALVIHANPDDYRTDPSGNSGSRIVCGVLNPTIILT
jgi:superoxide dismutase, Cu-Zn family